MNATTEQPALPLAARLVALGELEGDFTAEGVAEWVPMPVFSTEQPARQPHDVLDGAPYEGTPWNGIAAVGLYIALVALCLWGIWRTTAARR